MNRIEINVSTGERKVIPLTQADIDASIIASNEERLQQDAELLIELKQNAIQAEIEKIVDIEHGTSDEAGLYKEEKLRQGKI